MPLYLPSASKVTLLTQLLGVTLTLKLYSNDHVPVAGDTAANYTEVSGGGYAAKSLLSGTWVMTAGSPAQALYPIEDFVFTGTIGGSGNVYGYFVVDGSGNLWWAERSSFGAFTPISGSIVRTRPVFQLDNLVG